MPDQVKQRSRTKSHRSAQTSTESAGGLTATFESTPVESTPAVSVDVPAQDLRETKASSRKKSLRSAGGAAEPNSIEDVATATKAAKEHIICETPPAIVLALDEIPIASEPLGEKQAFERPDQGIAQMEEPAVRNGEDTGSRPVPLIEHHRGNSNGDAMSLVAGHVPPPADPSAGGEHVIQPTFDAATPERKPSKKPIVAKYEYTDEDGNYLFEVVRHEPKDFRPRVHLGNNRYKWTLEGIRRVPYRLHDFAKLDGQLVCVAEGEKDVDSLRKLGFIATCASGGANGWHKKYAEYLHKHTVAIFPDNDDAGEVYADAVATSIDGIAVDYRIIRLPDLPPKGDVTDFIERGGTKEDLLRLVTKAFSVPRPQQYALYEQAGDTLGRATGKPSTPAQSTWSIEACTFAEIKPEAIEWLWEPVWQDHCLNMLVGRPGAGKTFVACHLAALVSRGGKLPDSEKRAPLGEVVFCSSEDSLSKVIRPRLEAAGADLTKVWTWKTKKKRDRNGVMVDSEVSLEDVEAITEWVDSHPDLRLLVLDPATAFIAQVDANDNPEVRRVLNNLVKIAETKRFCVLLITHQKKSDTQAINSTIGAQAWVAVPRVVNLLVRDPDDPENKVRCLVPIKNNHAADDAGKKFKLVETEGMPGSLHILWDSAKEMRKADDLTAAIAVKSGNYGRENQAEKSLEAYGTKYLSALDLMPPNEDGWVAHNEIRSYWGWSGQVANDAADHCKARGWIEIRLGTKDMPNGGKAPSSKREVRRVRPGDTW